MSHEPVRTFVDDLPVGIWVARAPGGELVYANRRFQEILGIAARDDVAVGEYAEPYGICDRAGRPYPEDQMPFVRALVARQTVTVDDIVIHRPDGQRTYIRATARPQLDEAGEVHVVSIVFEDITGQVEAEVAMRRAQRLEAVGTLAGGVAHDFNNLLAGIRVVAETLADSEQDLERRRELERIVAASEIAADLTSALLGFARQRPPTCAPVEVGAVAEAVRGLLSRAVDPSVSIAVERSGDAWIEGDRAQLEQVVMNLVLNAAEATQGAGEVRVVVRTEGDRVLLDVCDRGPGIPLELQDRVFEPYFSTKSAEAGRSGTGLGLAVVLGIVEAHGGTIEIRDLATGTCLRVSLPASAAAPTDEAPAAPRRGARGTGVVLVVDDEALVRHAAQLALRQLGYETIEASSGRAALEVLTKRDGAVDAVLLALTMPELDGAATCRIVRDRWPGVRVVLSSGYALDRDVGALLRDGVDAFLPKPYGVRALSEVLRRVLDGGIG